jgi:hypothetical protein
MCLTQKNYYFAIQRAQSNNLLSVKLFEPLVKTLATSGK